MVPFICGEELIYIKIKIILNIVFSYEYPFLSPPPFPPPADILCVRVLYTWGYRHVTMLLLLLMMMTMLFYT